MHPKWKYAVVLLLLLSLGTGCTSQMAVSPQVIRKQNPIKRLYVRLKRPWRISKKITRAFTVRSVHEFHLIDSEIQGDALIGVIVRFKDGYIWRNCRPTEVKIALSRIDRMSQKQVDIERTISLLAPIALVLALSIAAYVATP